MIGIYVFGVKKCIYGATVPLRINESVDLTVAVWRSIFLIKKIKPGSFTSNCYILMDLSTKKNSA